MLALGRAAPAPGSSVVSTIRPPVGADGCTVPGRAAWRTAGPTSCDLTRAGTSRAARVEALEQLVRGQLDLLVAPLGGAIVARDQPHAVHAAEVSVDERVARLRAVGRTVGEAEVPLGVLHPRVRREEGVLLGGAGLGARPVAVQDVLARVDELLGPRDRGAVDGVGRHGWIVAQAAGGAQRGAR